MKVTSLLNNAFLLEMDEDTLMTGLGAVMAIAIIAKHRKKQKSKIVKRKRRIWCRKWLHDRYTGKDLTHLAKEELRLEDPQNFQNFCRLSKDSFDHLLCLVGPMISKLNTVLRESISTTTRLLITLRFLATGNTYKDLTYGFRVSKSSISILVPEVLEAIYKVLSPKYLKVPTSAAEWKNIANDFYQKWNFPMCLGAIDGKHIAFRAPKKDGSYYYNYKGFNSIILMAVVDANYNFVMVDVGTNGRANDAAAFNSSGIGDSIKQNLLDFPEDEELPGTDQKAPYVFISDDAFRLSRRVLKPFSQRRIDENKIFNYRLSRARRVVENSFGILASRFQIFQREINLPVEKVELITLVCCALHNYLSMEGQGQVEEPSSKKQDWISLEKSSGNNYADDASEVRNLFKHFFNNVDVLPWQHEAIQKFNF